MIDYATLLYSYSFYLILSGMESFFDTTYRYIVYYRLLFSRTRKRTWVGVATSGRKKQRNQDQNHGSPDDLIDGACEPLAYHLSSKMSQKEWAIFDLRRQYEVAKDQLEKLDPQVAASSVWTLAW